MNTEIRMPLPEFFLLRQKQTNIKKKECWEGSKRWIHSIHSFSFFGFHICSEYEMVSSQGILFSRHGCFIMGAFEKFKEFIFSRVKRG